MAKILVSIQNGNINKQIKTTWKIHEMVKLSLGSCPVILRY